MSQAHVHVERKREINIGESFTLRIKNNDYKGIRGMKMDRQV
jgi:hypothetical protein